MPMSDWRRSDPLCCCEYVNSNDERSHILECCCNCEVLDQTCERLITCRRIHRDQLSEIMNTILERFRVPWRGGAKQIACDSILPIFMQPLLAYIAIQNVWCTVLAVVILQVLLWYVCCVYVKKNPQTRVFFVWILTSVTLLIMVFEVSVVPFMEIRPEENVAFIVLVVCSLFCLYKVWSRSSLNHVIHNNSQEELLVNRSKVSENVCPTCRKRVPPRTYHCNICQTCVLKKEYHSTWLNCCIGEKNSSLFVLGIFLSFLSLIYGAVLTLTTVCHPVYIMEIFLLPDDCSDVYHNVEMAVCFVSAVYSLLLATVLLVLVIHHSWLISLGLTGQEWQELQGVDGRCCGMYADRPYNKGVLKNWIFLEM
ncbi:palmitoyltransferase ZDHHC23 isoform X2 [Anabrus simplex]|uniref:palmitoyltransferase ZDHHC23 isoform X2 n=1 Tax=Anabrus simplex TaxID=316456 RepID=UPI0035A2EFEB